MSSTNHLSARARAMFPLIEAYLASGLSQKHFCRQEGIAYSTFQWWLRQYRQRHVDAEAGSEKGNGFIPLRIYDPPRATLEDEGLYCEIEYPGGVVLRLSGRVEREVLLALIQITSR